MISILLLGIILLTDVLKDPSSLFSHSTKMKYETLPILDTMFDASTTSNEHIFNISSFFKIPPSISTWHTLDSGGTYGLSILSMRVDHHSDSSWYIPALHAKHSYGWNRTKELGFSNRPYACSLKFMGVGFESTLEGFQRGGTGYITVGFKDPDGKKFWHGFEKNETNRVLCYYLTNKDTGSEFIDKPKTLGVAVYCPILLDEEMGQFLFHQTLSFGKFCRPFAQYPVDVEIHLRPTNFPENSNEIIADFQTNPAEPRFLKIKEMSLTQTSTGENRNHAVCTVQTFKNPFTGPMLYLFMKYYQLLGWRVIVYDRFGFHYQYIKELLTLPGIDYYPFTVFQLANPGKYNKNYITEMGTDLKSFYKMEVNWGYSSKKLADTADQDADKTRTYDYARVEYAHLDTLFYLDADEFFFCPQAADSIESQRDYQQRIHNEFIARGIEEMRYVRIPYSGLAPPGFVNSPQNRSNTDFTNHTGHCMIDAYAKRELYDLFKCWSRGSSYDNFAKSADMAGICPFHYNHWSCDGMKGGGRDWTKVRCRCKVALDMQNNFEYRPMLRKCHLLHFNDNKYRFQSKRMKHQFDKGDVTAVNPLALFFSGNATLMSEFKPLSPKRPKNKNGRDNE